MRTFKPMLIGFHRVRRVHRVRAESPRTLTTGSASAFAVMGLIWAKKSTLRSSRAAQSSPSLCQSLAFDTCRDVVELFASERNTMYRGIDLSLFLKKKPLWEGRIHPPAGFRWRCRPGSVEFEWFTQRTRLLQL